MGRYDAANIIDQLLRQHESGLKGYIVLRLGGAERLEEVYSAIRDALSREDQALTQSAPSLRAAAYGAARRLAGAVRSDSSRESIVWLGAPEGRPARYTQTLDRVRSELDPDESEALELRHARELEPEEIDFVIGSSAGALVERAEHRVQSWLLELGDARMTLSTLVRDAFSPSLEMRGSEDASATGPAPLLMRGTVLGGRFQVGSKLEDGPVAASYLATDSSVPGRAIVIQLFHNTATTLAARTGSLRKLQRIDAVLDPSVERGLAYGWHENRLWRALPRYAGQTLGQLVRGGPLSSSEAIEVFQPIARGLGALHDQGITHGNISVDTIWLVQTPDDRTVPILGGLQSWIGESRAPSHHQDVHDLGVALLHALDPSTLARGTTEVNASGPVKPFAPLLTRAVGDAHGPPLGAAELAKELREIERGFAESPKRKALQLALIGLAVAVLLFGFVAFVREARLRLIEETLDAADAAALEIELERERQRSDELERRLDRASKEVD